MRTHRKIIRDRGASALARDLVARGINIHASTPQRWAERDSIPGEYWKPLVELGVATLNELAEAASAKRASAA